MLQPQRRQMRRPQGAFFLALTEHKRVCFAAGRGVLVRWRGFC